ncbi:MAG: bifunctional folylpolyglutamate synthase/dihydrofolate synthase [Crenarchaeota archaeon]|nr:bifunctional folylpolyglutamate synthase/dihydrofolate synthase [Thermoproteota archaeon]MDW8033746.1 folylpolyglutamate synthase/dihydrofolate synthase family protein [Nitrososphaerota archaeon]
MSNSDDEYFRVLRELYDLRGIKLGLDIIKGFLEELGNPERDYPIILVGGTNGKGSTVATISSILRESGFRVGTFTKPHLCRFTERIVVDGEEMDRKEVVEYYWRMREVGEKVSEKLGRFPTFFEFSTAMAFEYFSKKNVDVAVVEVGMGGRLDATNACDPLVSVITNVSLEHTKYLGDTVEKIAFEKSGIIRPGRPTVSACSGPALRVIEERCRELGSELTLVGRDVKYEVLKSDLSGLEMNMTLKEIVLKDLKVSLRGRFQAENVSTAVASVLKFFESIGQSNFNENVLKKSLSKVSWPGRLEPISMKPLVILDCAKDPAAAEALVSSIKEIMPDEKFTTVVSISSDKDYVKILNSLSKITGKFILTRHSVMGRALPTESMAEVLNGLKAKFISEPTVKDAVKKALSSVGEDGKILVTGSVFTVGEARILWSGEFYDGF